MQTILLVIQINIKQEWRNNTTHGWWNSLCPLQNNEYHGSSFDIVANTAKKAESVLIRGGMNIDDVSENYSSQPRLLGEALYIDYEQLNQADLTSSNDIWLEDDGFQVNGKYLKLKRIGLDSAKDISPEDKNRLLRFRLQNENRKILFCEPTN